MHYYLVIQNDDWVEVNGKEYYFHPDKKKFNDAKGYCSNNNNNAKLFEPRNREDNTGVSSMAESQGIKKFWIGISYNTTTKEFVYDHHKDQLLKGERRTYDVEKTFWAARQPNCSMNNDYCDDHCVVRAREYPEKWNNIPCNKKNAFVCERGKCDMIVSRGLIRKSSFYQGFIIVHSLLQILK